MAHPEPRIVWEMDSREPVLVPGHTPEPHPIVRASKRILRHWYSQTSITSIIAVNAAHEMTRKIDDMFMEMYHPLGDAARVLMETWGRGQAAASTLTREDIKSLRDELDGETLQANSLYLGISSLMSKSTFEALRSWVCPWGNAARKLLEHWGLK